MFTDWKEHTSHVKKKSFGELGKQYPKMLQSLPSIRRGSCRGQCADAKTRELIALAVAVTTRCESCT